MKSYYIASCLFTARFPKTSLAIMRYIGKKNIEPVRCCIPNFRVKQSENRIPEGTVRDSWISQPESASIRPGDAVYTLCPNCENIVSEQYLGAMIYSLWELLNQDEGFMFPDHSGLQAVVQDCWRTRYNAREQAAVRSLLNKMGIQYREAEKHHENTDFCGSSLYRAQPKKNAHFAPRHYVEQAAGLFQPHSEEEQTEIKRKSFFGTTKAEVT